jgi:hypothetical protein
MLSEAKHLQYLLEHKQIQILRSAQDDNRGDLSRSLSEHAVKFAFTLSCLKRWSPPLISGGCAEVSEPAQRGGGPRLREGSRVQRPEPGTKRRKR